MNSYEGMGQFARIWTDFYKEEIPKKVQEEDEKDAYENQEEKRKALLSPKGHFRTIIDIGKAAEFATVAELIIVSGIGKLASSDLVDLEYEAFCDDLLVNLDEAVASSERKTIKQRIQTRQLATMKTFEYFGLLKVEVHAGDYNNPLNTYVLTQKGRELMAKLKGEKQ